MSRRGGEEILTKLTLSTIALKAMQGGGLWRFKRLRRFSVLPAPKLFPTNDWPKQSNAPMPD